MQTLPDFTAPVQTTWERAVHTVAARAKAALGEASHGRIDKAAQIVLTGGVRLNDDHSAVVASQAEPLKGWSVNGACACPDFAHAPSHLCKHRIACHLQRRALELAEPPTAWDIRRGPYGPTSHVVGKTGEAREYDVVGGACSCPDYEARATHYNGYACAHVQAVRAQDVCQAPTPETQQTAVPALPEAPASVNVRVLIGGREVQWTLRDTDEARLAERLTTLLARYPLPDTAPVAKAATEPQPTPDGWCLVHAIQMRKNSNDRGSWFSHKHGDQWCRGKGK